MSLAELSRLKLTEEEITSLSHDISNILEYVGQVNAAQTGEENKNPLVHNVLRDDAPRSESDPLSGTRDAVLAALPKREGDYNVVRKIIQKDE